MKKTRTWAIKMEDERYFEEKYKDLVFYMKMGNRKNALLLLRTIYTDGYDSAMEYHKEGK